MRIGSLEVGRDNKPLVVAEMSGNHNQSLEKALQITEAAASCGVHALKLQTYTPDTLTLPVREQGFIIEDPTSPWVGWSLYDLYQQAHTPWEWHEKIIKRSNELGMICFSTPFDESAVDFLEDLDVPAYKIASFENTHLPLIKKIANTAKPIMVSTGMASQEELSETVQMIRAEGGGELILLKCTSSYPANPKHSNLLTIPHMMDLFRCEVGVSDHTPGIGASIAGVALGASVIEKHFTICRKDGGLDAGFSLEPDEMSSLVKESERAWNSLGEIVYGSTEDDIASVKIRRSIYACRDVSKGKTLTRDDVRIIRPGYGLPPKYFESVIGKTAKRDIKYGKPLCWEDIIR